MPDSSVTARARERAEPRPGGALGAALFSALMFGSFVHLPLLLPFALLAPFPLLVARLRAGAVPALLALVSAAALLGAIMGGGQGLAYLMLVAPVLLIGESMARGRGMVRGCAWAFAVLALEIGAALLFAHASMERMALAPFEQSRSEEFLEGMRASMPPEQVEAFREQVAATHDAMQVVYPAAYIISVGVIVLLNAGLLRLYLRRRDPGWLDAGEFESVRWPFATAVAFVATGAAVLSPVLRPAAYNGLLILAFFFALQGLAVVSFYALRLAAPPLLRAAVLVLVLINPWAPQILALIGLFDIWFDFRKWAEPPEARK
ncbi:MAG TPA: DUF2232 domain-containing protein [Vicinamibacteria bacterium]|nr:DUF2232 domain-containing protein [Vicinamibacteria bacterium]